MTKTSRFISLVVVVVSLVGCAGFNRAMQLQDDYASHISSSNRSKLFISKQYAPSVTRGTISTRYSAFLPEGWYVPIASSAGRTFFQAPEGFEYRAGGEINSKVGGIVQTEAGVNSKFYVWYFPRQNDYFEIQPNGKWVNNIEPGLANVATRPWVEGDLTIEK